MADKCYKLAKRNDDSCKLGMLREAIKTEKALLQVVVLCDTKNNEQLKDQIFGEQ